MQCDAAIELLPWLLNGSLEPAEAAQVRRHLASCESCRDEFAAVKQVAADTGSHPPAQVIADYALGQDVDSFPREVLEAHLAHCEDCSREVELVAAPEQAPSPIPVQRPDLAQRTPPWRLLAAAAGFVAVALSVALLWQQQRPVQPVANVAVVEVLPDRDRVRGDAEVGTIVEKGPLTALLLVAAGFEDATSAGPYRALIASGDGRVHSRIDGLSRTENGDFTLLLPTAELPGGTLELRVIDREDTTVATYRLRLIDQPVPGTP